jgi:hypothetical protein
MRNLLVRALVNLVEANESVGHSPRVAFVRAFVQVLTASEEDVVLLGGEAQ